MEIQNLQSTKLILLDLDETIYDQKHCSQEGLKAVAQSYNEFQNFDLGSLEKLYFNELHTNHLKVIDNHLTEEEAHFNRFETLANHCKLNCSQNDIKTMIEIYNKASNANKRVIPGAIETVEYLINCNYQIAIITNGPSANQRKKISFCKIEDLVDLILISEEVGIRKPKKEIFEIALDHFSTPKQNTIMVGDSWDSDITGALNASIQPIWYNRRNNINQNPNQVIEINNITELKKIL